MSEQERHTDDLRLIRKMMEESSRFLSLSGLSGVFIGLYAILGVLVAKIFILSGDIFSNFQLVPDTAGADQKKMLLLLAFLILLPALGTAYYFALKESKAKNKQIWSQVTKNLLLNLFVPLFAGAFFILALIINGNFEYLGASMLIFYGIALFNAGKFTFGEVQVLGILEIVLGVCAALFPSIDILMWLVGFGLLHILYGLILHRKYR